MKPKIGLFVASLSGGGAERVMTILANSFARRAYPTQLVIAKPDLTYAPEIASEVQLINLNTYRMARTVLALARYLREHQPAVLLATLVEANIVALIARTLARTPTRIVIREATTPSQRLKQHDKWTKRWTGKIFPRFYQHADAIVAVSSGVYRDLIESARLNPQKVHLIPNPVPLHTIAQKMTEPLEHPWFEASAPPVILSVGRLEKVKDYPTLLRAFSRVVQSVEARLLILGEGSMRPELEALTRSLGLCERVQMPGFDPNPFRYMRRSRLFVLSSRYEGFPNVLVQALACGCPVVSTDCPSGPRDILNDGAYGVLVPVGDEASLALAIQTCLASPPLLAPPEWLTQYDESRVVEQFLQVLFPSGG